MRPGRKASCVGRLKTSTLSNSTRDELPLSTTIENEGPNFILPFWVDSDGICTVSLGEGGGSLLPHGTPIAEHRLSPITVLSLYQTIQVISNDPKIKVLIVSASGRYWCNGFDLKYMQKYPECCNDLQKTTEELCALILTMKKVTIAAVNGHAVAAGAMLMLCFDKVIMNNDKGFCFVPGVDLGLVYSYGMTELMKAKLPLTIRHDFIVFGLRYTANTLAPHGVVIPTPALQVNAKALELANELKQKAKYPDTLGRIKETLYHEAVAALECEVDTRHLQPKFTPMGFGIIPMGKDRPVGTEVTAGKDGGGGVGAGVKFKEDAIVDGKPVLPVVGEQQSSGAILSPIQSVEQRRKTIIMNSQKQSMDDMQSLLNQTDEEIHEYESKMGRKEADSKRENSSNLESSIRESSPTK